MERKKSTLFIIASTVSIHRCVSSGICRKASQGELLFTSHTVDE